MVTDQPPSVVRDSVTAVTGIYPIEVFCFFFAVSYVGNSKLFFDPSMFLHFSVLLLNRSKMIIDRNVYCCSFKVICDFLSPSHDSFSISHYFSHL